jgi:ABC-2 family transporter
LKPLYRYFWLHNRSALVWTGLGLFITAWLLAAPLAPLKDGVLKLIAESPLLQKFGAAVMGVDLQGELTVKLLAGTTWSHPFLFALLWGFGVNRSSHFPVQAAEDRTIDFLYSLPRSRAQILIAQSVILLLGLVLLATAALLGFLLGCRPLGQDALSFQEVFPLTFNLFCSAVAVLSLATLASVVFESRSRAIGACSLFCLWSLLLGYLQPLILWAKKLSFLGLLHYFRPGEILQSSAFPTQNCILLLSLGLVAGALALVLVDRRDLA